MKATSRWEKAFRLHGEATASLVDTVRAVAPEKWREPRGAGKWTPAEVVQHLTLGYDAILGELSGGPGMRRRAAWWMQMVLRWTVLPRILRGQPFPRAKAPRETRPEDGGMDQATAVTTFLVRAAQFEKTATPDRNEKLTHPYFGKIGLRDSVTLVARHIEHHRQQLL